MKLYNLLNDRLIEILNELRKQRMPVMTSYALKGIRQRIDQELDKYDDVRQSLLIQYGKKDDNGELIMNDKKQVTFDEENQSKFFEELQKLVNIDVDIGTIKVASLGDQVLLSEEDLIVLDGLIE